MTRRSILSGESAEEMWGIKKRKVDETDIDVTPLVDCVFLLLSFFMMTSPMKGNPDRNIPTAYHGIGVDPNGTTAIRISRGSPPRRSFWIIARARSTTCDPSSRREFAKGIRWSSSRPTARFPAAWCKRWPRRPPPSKGSSFRSACRTRNPRNDRVTRWRFDTTVPTAANF